MELIKNIKACCGLLIAAIVLSPWLLLAKITPSYLRVEYKENPYVDEVSPRLSWELTGSGFNQWQSAYQILVASSEELLSKNQGDLWDSGKTSSGQTNQIAYQGKTIERSQRVYWKVCSWDGKDLRGDWSSVNYWERGKAGAKNWSAGWIGLNLNAETKGGEYALPPSPYLRKEVSLPGKVKSARLYISSLGLQNFYINGTKVGQDYFASGWTDYNKRVYYNVYDVSELLAQGNNTFGSILSGGWYSGYLGYAVLVGSPQVNKFYGDFPLLKAQIDIEYTDGSKQRVSTDGSWKANTGAVQESDFLQGETHDARLEPEGWKKAGFDDSSWKSVQEVADMPGRELQMHPGNPVRVVKELAAKSIKNMGDGKYIVDFGQNFAGVIRLKLKGETGDSLVFRYGEMLFPDGRLMTDNLRKARAKDTYVFKGTGKPEEWSPSFTFHGFQFVEISGLREAPSKDFITGLALSSTTAPVGAFSSDNAMLNQLYENIVWTQRANYIDIPTDCPQRDERLGWTGDAQVYMRSAIFNADVAAFHTKWIQDLNDSQWGNGAFPIYAPMPVGSDGVAAIRADDAFSPGWSEAGIICTYEIFKAYNDVRIVRKSMPYMLKFMDFLKKRTQQGVLVEGSFEDVTPKGGFGDWLSVGEKTSPDLLATTYYYYCNMLMAQMAEALAQTDQAKMFQAEMAKVKRGFKKHYMDAGGKLKTDGAVYGDGTGYVEGEHGFAGHTQTGYANALYSGILDQDDAVLAGKYLRELVEKNGDKLTTGFLGFKPLLPALSASGSTDKAYHLLQSEEYPSLGYEVANGATSIWERWDSYTKDQGFVHNAAMNSFSHYAFGSVNEWIFENMIGIKAKENGFQEVYIKPEIGPYGIKEVSGSYHSIAGEIKSAWQQSEQGLIQNISIPINVKAFCYIKAPSIEVITLNDEPLETSKYVREINKQDDFIVVQLGSGNYAFKVKGN